MSISPIFRNISTSNIEYKQAKTKADNFVTRINQSINSNQELENSINESIIEEEQVSTFSLQETEPNKLKFDISKIKKEVAIDTPSGVSYANSKTTAHNFKQQLENSYNDENNAEFNFTDLGLEEPETDFNEVSSILSEDLPKASDIKKLSITNKLNNFIESSNIQESGASILRARLNSLFETRALSSINENSVIPDIVNDSLEETVSQLIENAEVAESLLNLSTIPTSDGNLIKLLEKFREIITTLDKAVRELEKEVEQKKKDSKVEIKIKRFDIRDIQTKKKILT